MLLIVFFKMANCGLPVQCEMQMRCPDDVDTVRDDELHGLALPERFSWQRLGEKLQFGSHLGPSVRISTFCYRSGSAGPYH
jgi:hypothetical protein